MSFALAQDEVFALFGDLLPADYLRAIEWDDDNAPFSNLGARIALVTQVSGSSGGDRDTRVQDVQVWIFTSTNYDGSAMRDARDNAQIVRAWMLQNSTYRGIKGFIPLSDVSGPYRTGNGRRFYRFDCRCMMTNTRLLEA